MDYEKAYKDALERAKRLHDNPNASRGRKEWLESIFPELHESEDEKIRKALIALIKEIKTQPLKRLEDWDTYIAYLEKQKIVPVQTEKERIYIRTLQSLISDFLRDHGDQTNTEFYQGCWDWLEGRHIEQKLVEWSEEDEKMRQRLIVLLGRIWANTKTDCTSVNYCFTEEIDWLKSLCPQSQL